MLTFTEFFTKKKIDLQAIKNARPELYQEFERDYDQMGEKSFDHSKKYWFNRLRKQFLLASIEIPKSSPSEPQAKRATSSEEAASKPTGFRPRFKASTQNVPPENKDVQDSVNQGGSSKPSGFKPRFKAGVTSSDGKRVDKAESPETDSEPASSPKGFTPRFKSKQQTDKAPDSEKDGVRETPVAQKKDSQTSSKPTGFKPRFKAGITQSAPSADLQNEDKRSENIKGSSLENEGQGTVSRPQGFKPRFKAKPVTDPANTPIEDPEAKPMDNQPANSNDQHAEAGATDDQPTAASKEQVESAELTNDAKRNPDKKPLGFKPRMLQQKKNKPDKDSSDTT